VEPPAASPIVQTKQAEWPTRVMGAEVIASRGVVETRDLGSLAVHQKHCVFTRWWLNPPSG